MRRGLGVLGAVISLLFVCASACSSATGTNTAHSGSGGSGAGTGGTGGGINTDGGGTGGLSSSCAKAKYTGELVPLDMFVMLDRSGSMQDSGKWPAVTGALGNFVSLPGLSGIGMGIGFFPTQPATPPPSGSCAPGSLTCGVYECVPILDKCSGAPMAMPNDSCVDTDYAKPVVGIAPLPGVGTAINSAIAGQQPTGDSTPTDAALHGAIEYAEQWAGAHPDDITIVVLATDGEPNNCNPNTIQTVAARAAQGVSNKPSIKTFVIGVGSSLTSLNAIAQSGGTGQALIVDTANNPSQQFLDALDKIRGSVGCALKLPQPQNGQTPDYNKVNVVFTPDGGKQQVIPYKNDASGCQAGKPGWYYTPDPNNPTHIKLCPASCDLVSNTKGATQVIVGCAHTIT